MSTTDIHFREFDYQTLADWLTAKVAHYVHADPRAVDVDMPLADCGIDSVSGLSLCADMHSELGIAVDSTIVWDYPTIDAIASYLATERLAS